MGVVVEVCGGWGERAVGGGKEEARNNDECR